MASIPSSRFSDISKQMLFSVFYLLDISGYLLKLARSVCDDALVFKWSWRLDEGDGYRLWVPWLVQSHLLVPRTRHGSLLRVSSWGLLPRGQHGLAWHWECREWVSFRERVYSIRGTSLLGRKGWSQTLGEDHSVPSIVLADWLLKHLGPFDHLSEDVVLAEPPQVVNHGYPAGCQGCWEGTSHRRARLSTRCRGW